MDPSSVVIEIRKRTLLALTPSFLLFLVGTIAIGHVSAFTNDFVTFDQTIFGYATRIKLPYVAIFIILLSLVYFYSIVLLSYYFIWPIMIKYHKTKSLKRVPWYHSTLAAILTAVLIAGIVFLRIFQPYERLSQVFIPIGAFVYYGFSVLVYPALFYVTLKGLYEYQHYKANTSSANISPYSLRFYTFVFFLIALVAGLIFFITAPVWFDSALVIEGEISSKPNLIAHRGLVSDAPENTIPAFEKALQAGAWGISSKVYFSLDKVAFLHHDSTFMRTTNIENIFPDRVNDYCGGFNYTDIQKLEAGSWFDSSFNGTAIPTFNEVLLLIKKYPGTFFIFDIFPPATNHPAYTTYAKAMRDQIIAAGVASQVTDFLIARLCLMEEIRSGSRKIPSLLYSIILKIWK